MFYILFFPKIVEIDRVLKKVSEGVEMFESMIDKLEAAPPGNQKEKCESDLKKEIKKLQRLRDQIKSWLSMNEIKDKSALMENRKLIEQQMERFKVIEREMKTKAFSKEGLSQSAKLDPKEKEKLETSEWVSSMVDELDRQREMKEAESETLQRGMKKGKKDHAKTERLKEFEHQIERYKFHVGRLELINRLLGNDQLDTEQVLSIQEDIKYFVESNQEPDFEEDEYIYDDLNLEEEERIYSIPNAEDVANPSPEDEDEETEKLGKGPSLPPPAKASSLQVQTQPIPRKANDSTATSPVSSKSTSPLQSRSPVDIKSTIAKTPSAPAIQYAQAAAATSQRLRQDSGSVTSPSAQDREDAAFDRHAETEEGKSQTSPSITSQAETTTAVKHISNSSAPSKPQETKDITEALPNSLSDLVSSFEALKSRAVGKNDKEYNSRMLDASFTLVPDIFECERPKQYQAKQPYQTPSYYPQTALDIFDNPAFFERVDVDALFFIFYYRQGTYQQYLAARELKRQSWRFHKKYLTWFQRHDEPQTITEDYEQGTYIYFDYEHAWCQRKKSDFRFEYKFLEDSDFI
ncbi:general negative regulator of transcription subunit 5 [Umbelopsis sp. WA50703]